MTSLPNNSFQESKPLVNLPLLLPNLIASIIKADRSERFYDVLVRRFGLAKSKEYTLEDIGHYYEVTRERIRQIEANAIEYLRRVLLTGKQRGAKFSVPLEFIQETHNLQTLLTSLKDIEREDVIIRALERFSS